MPPLSMLRAFEAAARLGGFSAAGRELNVTHAAVAQQVRHLEERLGVTLMRRDGRGLLLTVEGRRLSEALSAGLETMRAGLQELQSEADERPVSVTLTPAFSASWLMPRIGGLREDHPEIELMLSPSSDLVNLQRSDFDLAIRFGTGDWPGLKVEPLVSSSIVVVAAPQLLEKYPVETPEDLLRLPWVQELGTDEWRVWLADHGVNFESKRDIIHLPGYMAIQALREGQGVGMTARIFVEAALKAGRLIALFDSDEESNTGYYIVRRNMTMRKPVAAFVSWLKREAAKSESGSDRSDAA